MKPFEPDQPLLFSSFPNPFNPTTSIRYALPDYAQVKVSIFDMSGRLVRTLDQSQATSNEFIWDGSSEEGLPMSGGVYICRLQTKTIQASIKLVLLK